MRPSTPPVDQLRRQVGDITEGVTCTPVNNGRLLLDQYGLDDHERAESCMDINRFAERLSKIPVDARSLLSLIVIRGDKVPAHVAMGQWQGEFQIPKRVLNSIADCTNAQLRQHIEVLEHFDLLRCDDEPFDGPPLYVVGNSTQGMGWALLQDIRDFCGTDREAIRRVLCDLDFSALDRG